jgi:hypothetical protein
MWNLFIWALRIVGKGRRGEREEVSKIWKKEIP